jgi:heat shock protein HslJ
MSDDGDRLIESRLEQLWQQELAGAEGYRPESRGSRPPRTGVLGQLAAAVVLVVLVGGFFYVSPMGPGGRSSTTTPTPYPGEPTSGTLETPTLPPSEVTPGPPVTVERYSVDASVATGDLLLPGTQLEIDLYDNGLFSAWAGCNYISGSYSISGGRLVVSDLSQTLIGCYDNYDAQDTRVRDLLQSRPSFSQSDTTLVISTADLTLTLTRMPDGGISRDKAIELARQQVVRDPVFETAQAGRFGDFGYLFPGEDLAAAGFDVDETVWIVTFSTTVEICPPPVPSTPGASPACETRPGEVTVVLDFQTGDWVTTSTFSPNPAATAP